MAEEIKFSEEELKSLQELSQSYQNIQASFGQMKVQKILNQQQADALEEAEGVRVSSMTIYKALKTRMSLNMKTAGKMAKAHDDEQRQRFLDRQTKTFPCRTFSRGSSELYFM